MMYYGHLLEQWSLEMDLIKDLELFMKKEMQRVGINPSNTRNILYEYFNMLKRIISIRPRRVVYSNEFQCPEEYKPALLEFEDNARKGKNLNKYQSDKITRPEESDDLLNDWNIVHFHLSRRFRDDGFAKRSNYQIFAWITDDCIYMIQVYPHKADFLYCKKELLNIVERNWPNLLEPYRLKDICSLNEQFDDEQYEQIREAHISTLIQTENDKCYGFLGGGYMSDGSSGEAVRNEFFWNNRLKICEDVIRRNMTSILQVIREQCNYKGYTYTEDCGQVSINISRPGITKGQHWHNFKWELFIVVAGHGLIQERNINTGETVEFEISGDKIEAVHMIPGWTHNIINLSETENLVTVMTCNEIFDPGHPDTFGEPV